MDATNFIAMEDGTIINLAAIAWIDAHTGPRVNLGDIRIVFSSAYSTGDGLYNVLEKTYGGKEAAYFLAELDRRGIDTKALRESRKPPSTGL